MPSARIGIKVDDPERLLRLLDGINDKVRQSIAVKALDAAARPILRQAKALVPKRYGALRQSLGVLKRRYSGAVAVVIGPRRGLKSKLRSGLANKGIRVEPANYAHLVEYGTRPHRTTKGSNIDQYRTTVDRFGKATTRLAKKAQGQDSGNVHPGSRPKPFLRPAVDANKQNVKGILERVIAEEFDRLVSGARR